MSALPCSRATSNGIGELVGLTVRLGELLSRGRFCCRAGRKAYLPARHLATLNSA
jgi:hypothetical protein